MNDNINNESRAVERVLVLDAETVAAVSDVGFVMRPYRAGLSRMNLDPGHRAKPGDILTHLPTPTGMRPVAELVAAHDAVLFAARTAKTHFEMATDRGESSGWGCIADDLFKVADLLIDARLVAAAHEQWADTGEVK